MAISTGEQSGVNANINVTPMIDVMLVLLIIFMLVTPLLAAGFQATMPLAKNVTAAEEKDDEIRLGIDVNGAFFVQGQQLSAVDAEAKLKEMFAARPLYHILHLKADAGLPYGKVQEGIEMGRRAGASNLIAITDRKGGLSGIAEGKK